MLHQADARAARITALAGAVEEGAACPRPAAAAIGAPKVTVHRIGTGTTSPLGMTRCTLSIQAGISCDLGERLRQRVEARLERLPARRCGRACPRER